MGLGVDGSSTSLASDRETPFASPIHPGLLAMEPLQRLLELATSEQMLSPINNRAAKLRVSLYADDASIFLNPVKEEVHVSQILDIFGNVLG
jgi:hypothetical protein